MEANLGVASRLEQDTTKQPLFRKGAPTAGLERPAEIEPKNGAGDTKAFFKFLLHP